MLRLPQVTLVIHETQRHRAALLVLRELFAVCEFGDVVVLTDRLNEFSSVPNLRFHYVPNWTTKLAWAQATWREIPPLIGTTHALYVQWDAGIDDVTMWRDDWLQYDYIGALWPWYPERRVGNSGFSLQSTRLTTYVREHVDEFPCTSELEDDLLCRVYRPRLERAGFKWAHDDVAKNFAIEHGERTRHFGWHGHFNWSDNRPRGIND